MDQSGKIEQKYFIFGLIIHLTSLVITPWINSQVLKVFVARGPPGFE